jgi:hypothetical protein
MRGFLINKNLSVYYWLKKRIGKERAYRVAIVFEKVILIFGRGTYERNKTLSVSRVLQARLVAVSLLINYARRLCWKLIV